MGFLVLQCLSKGRFARYLRAIFQKIVILKLGLLIFEQAFFLLHRSRRGQSLARAAVFPFPVQRCASLCDIKRAAHKPGGIAPGELLCFMRGSFPEFGQTHLPTRPLPLHPRSESYLRKCSVWCWSVRAPSGRTQR